MARPMFAVEGVSRNGFLMSSQASRSTTSPANFLWRFLIGRGIQRYRRAANCMPGGNPADESPGVIAPLSQLGHGRATDLKSANAINRDRPASRQLLDPARQRGRSVHGGARQHIGASGQVSGLTEIQKYRSASIVALERDLQLFGRNPRLFLRRRAKGRKSLSSPAPSPIAWRYRAPIRSQLRFAIT